MTSQSSFLVLVFWILKDFILVMVMRAITFTPDTKCRKLPITGVSLQAGKCNIAKKGQASHGLLEGQAPIKDYG